MAKSFKYDKRVLLPKGVQKSFIESAQEKLGISLEDFANRIGVHRRTLFDWKREKFLVSLTGLSKLSKLSGLPIPEKVKIKDPFWYVDKGAKTGGIAVIKKYGRIPVDEGYRKKKWQEWWQKEGRFQNQEFFSPLPFSKPKLSEKLAEFFGIMMGDGGISKRQICITLHYKDDAEFSKYVAKRIRDLFSIEPSIRRPKGTSVNRVVVSRVGLVRYLNELGLVIGNKVKQNFDIPDWIKENDVYLKSCVRGLVDTDGCIILHRYKVNEKEYVYKKLSFTTMSNALRKTVFDTFRGWGFKARIARDRDVRIDSIRDMKLYFTLVGSHNPKHLKKWLS